MQVLRLAPLAALFAALMSCDGGSPGGLGADAQAAGTPQADAAAMVDAGAPTDAADAFDVPAAQDTAAAVGPYPDGPYGSREGAVLANLEWEGYVNTAGERRSTELEFGPTSLQALRGDGRGYALIHLAEFL